MSVANYITKLSNGKSAIDLNKDGLLECNSILVTETITAKNIQFEKIEEVGGTGTGGH